MELELSEIFTGIGIVTTIITVFFTTIYKLRESNDKKIESLTEKVNQLEKKLIELKSKDDLQQQVIDQIGSQMEELVPKLINALSKGKKLKK